MLTGKNMKPKRVLVRMKIKVIKMRLKMTQKRRKIVRVTTM